MRRLEWALMRRMEEVTRRMKEVRVKERESEGESEGRDRVWEGSDDPRSRIEAKGHRDPHRLHFHDYNGYNGPDQGSRDAERTRAVASPSFSRTY